MISIVNYLFEIKDTQGNRTLLGAIAGSTLGGMGSRLTDVDAKTKLIATLAGTILGGGVGLASSLLKKKSEKK